MDSITSPPPCPNTVSVRRNPPRRGRPTPMKAPIPSQLEELLPTTISDPPLPTVADQAPPSESLKVFLRIKPIVRTITAAACKQLGEATRSRAKNAWPQNPTAKKNSTKEKQPAKKIGSEICISVTDSHSVTISPPPLLVDSKKIKSEVYEGFSHVFAPDSLQNEVYEKMVKPIVDDFLEGRSGMLAALGPSGSGKTHTVFGTPRERGMVPLALQHIFKQSKGRDCKFSRSFYLSIFEIYSERGKGEKICDLIPERVDSGLQSSSKRVQEVMVSNAPEAESLIACAMLKRATSMTNTNSQSSRSQCIINLHMKRGEGSNQPDDAVLTVVDLAGAEREKRTGNQGAKLLESNFINNTSMVFGLCLRALLEHQKNPKKPLQKHFQNSLLTKYLREYLEGKKRMSLILTVKPGEDDYLDTACLLRQASPYMKIKFNNIEDPSSSICNKRSIQSFSRIGQQKRMKPSAIDAQTEEPKTIADGNLLLQEVQTNEASTMDKPDSIRSSSVKLSSNESLTRERSHIIMQNFAKAIWRVLKQYKDKLLVAEREVESVGENLRNEMGRRIELEKELEDLKSRCTCSKENTEQATLIKVEEAERVLESSPVDSPKSTEHVSEHICSVPEPKPCDSPKSTESVSEQICFVSEPTCNSPNTTGSISEQIQQDTDTLAQTNAAKCSPHQASKLGFVSSSNLLLGKSYSGVTRNSGQRSV
ncbi:unnamed protein product [Linum tenue]|uniref:Kinesin motor domain-containing protein n=1 Tax=Linum tenue TaxID=586396 RepID=A0AAV0HEE2_9ROSI|nr:unnamed protein product [Linum tenue]